MRTTEITVGAEYAVEKHSGYFARVRVLEIGPWTRQVYSGARWDRFGHRSTTKGVRYVELNAQTGAARTNRDGAEIIDWCVPGKVKSLWTDHADAAQDAAERAANLDKRLANIEADTQALVPGIRIRFARTSFQTTYVGTTTISASDLEKLMRAAAAEGARRERANAEQAARYGTVTA